MTELEAVKDLATHDHAILKPAYARKVWAALGLEGDPPIHLIEHQPNEFKGSILYGAEKAGERASGVDADYLAEAACRALELDYPHMFGRGTRLRVCCQTLRKHFEQKVQADG